MIIIIVYKGGIMINQNEKDNESKSIFVVFEESRENDGLDVVRWLAETGNATKEGEPEVTQDGLNIYRFTALIPIYRDSSIIFLSDEATENKDWQKYIEELPEEIRPIPIGRTQNAKQKNENAVPKRIDQLNYIRLNDERYIHLLDALITDPEFYLMKNYLISRSISWSLTKNDEYLLSKSSEIKRYKKAIDQKRESEVDPRLADQLNRISGYLNASRIYTNAIAKAATVRWIKRGILLMITIALFVVFFKVKSALGRATYANIVLGASKDSGESMVNAVKMTEAITNPYTPALAKKIAHNRLVEYLDDVWAQNVIGGWYKYELKDIAIPSGSRYLWTASAGGKALLWDTYNGTISESYELSDCALIKIAISGSGNTLAALDERGTLYVREESSWNSIGKVASVTEDSEFKLTDEKAVVCSDALVQLIDLKTKEIQSLEKNSLINVDIQSDGSVLVFFMGEENRLCSLVWDGKNNRDETSNDIILTENYLYASDLKNGMLVLTDREGQVWTVREGKAERVPLVLKQPISLAIINEDTLAYHERNMGTGMYCISGMFDYGNTLAAFKGLKSIQATEEALVLKKNFEYTMISLADILPANSLPAATEAKYDSGEYSMPVDRDGIQNVKIEPNGVIDLSILFNGVVNRVLIDPAMVLHNIAGYYSEEDLALLDQEYNYYEQESVLFDGLPVIAGIRYVPANDLVNEDYYYLLLASRDGSFAELSFSPENGDMALTYKHKIPSGSRIKAIYQVEDGYWLEDTEGRIWKSGTGINLLSNDGIFETVKSKIKSRATQDLKELVSSYVWDSLGLDVYPGGDGKEWE